MYKANTKCRICKSDKLTQFISLGSQPLANALLKKEDLKNKEKYYPLDVYVCSSCNLAQLSVVVSKEELFRNYVYFTSGMPKISTHFKQYAEYVIEKYLKKSSDLVVEIASNDGILLKFFKEKKFRILGIEPARNIAKTAQSIGIPTVCEFFSEAEARNIVKKYGKAKAVLANNVVAHIDDYHDLCKGIKQLLDQKGVFVFEAPYLIDMFDNLTFDTIYHEHLSYLAVRPLIKLFDMFDLEIFDVKVIPIHGISIRVFVGHKGEYVISNNVSKYVKKELVYGLNKKASYLKLAKRVENSKMKLLKVLNALKKKNKRIAAYGAPAKGNTLLNYYKIGKEVLEYALEDLPSKQGFYSPGMHIPIVDRAYAESHLPEYYLLLAWNYTKPILEKEKKFRKNGGKFIIPVGDTINII